MYGELIPVGGGDPVPLLKKQLLIGRRESCDIVLRFANVSAHHCQLTINGGYWYVQDMKSRNGVKVNGLRVSDKRLDPGDTLTVSKHRYVIEYSPVDLGAVGPPPPDDMPSDIMEQTLLERAGLQPAPGAGKGRPRKSPAGKDRHGGVKRYDVTDDSAGQIKTPDKPV